MPSFSKCVSWMPLRAIQQATHPLYQKCLHLKKTKQSPLRLPQLQHRLLATPQLFWFQHRLQTTPQIHPFLATLQSISLQHHLLPMVQIPSIHHHLTHTPIRQFQHHWHQKRDYPRLYWQSSNEMLCNFEFFWDSFESTVHMNTDLTKTEKFNYLVSLLEGTASRAITELPITKESYAAAVDIIKK